MKIDDFSARSLHYIFVDHISREARVTTDKWRGYRPISKAYNITQIESNRGLNFKALHTMIHQVKSWIRTTYSLVSDSKNLTAAVFPYPEMADHMVRQRSDKWNIDEVYPMIYHGFYNEEIDWIGYATKQGVANLGSKSVDLNTGVYLPPFSSNKELEQAILLAKKNSAKGITFFDGGSLTDAYLKTIKKVKKSL